MRSRDGAHGSAAGSALRIAIPGLVIILLLALLVLVYAGYRRDIRRARERTLEGSHVVQTTQGLIEYASVGEGFPILVAHGAGGGCDQGLDFAGALGRDGFRVIAVSRFGYLRSPLPVHATAEAQAEAYAGLLDALHIQRAVVIGLSAGAPSAMQFALRYGERTAALVLMVPAAYPPQVETRSGGAAPKQVSGVAKILFDAALKSDFLFWAMPRLAPRAMMRALVGTLPEVVDAADDDERARAARVLDHLLPFSRRRLGLLNDAAIVSSLPRYELEHISAPTLVVSAADDLFGTWEPAQYSAEHIPGARFVGYARGGHLLIGHMRDALFEIASFLRTREDTPWS